jgi:SOS-response transcriptional repressor LexA
MPVPDFLNASDATFAYRMSPNDYSMVTDKGLSLAPGTIVCADPQMPILPGKFVLAYLAGYDEPVVRVYRAKRPYAPGVSFELAAQNPAFEPITVESGDDCLLIARIFFFGSQA